MFRRRLIAAVPVLLAAGVAPSLALADHHEKDEAKEAKTVEVRAGEMTLTVPESWKRTPPANRLRLAQFVVPAAEGVQDESELTVFGGFGGSDADNLQRWVDQFVAEGREVSVVKGEGREGDYKLLDAKGTWNAPDGPPMMRKTIEKPNSRMLAAIVAVPGEGNYFLKLAGPAKTIDAQVDAFRASFGGDKETEEKFELK